MVLTREAIRRELAAGRLEIDPLADDQIGPASIDLHLGDEIRVMDGGGDAVAVTDDADYRTITQLRPLDAAVRPRAGRDHPRHHARARAAPARLWPDGSRDAAATPASGS